MCRHQHVRYDHGPVPRTFLCDIPPALGLNLNRIGRRRSPASAAVKFCTRHTQAAASSDPVEDSDNACETEKEEFQYAPGHLYFVLPMIPVESCILQACISLLQNGVTCGFTGVPAFLYKGKLLRSSKVLICSVCEVTAHTECASYDDGSLPAYKYEKCSMNSSATSIEAVIENRASGKSYNTQRKTFPEAVYEEITPKHPESYTSFKENFNSSTNFILCGDFNVAPIRDENNYKALINILESYSLKDIVHDKTRNCYTTDHIFSNTETKSEVIGNHFSDHKGLLGECL
nr:unnamed protein product [Callosobruchus analis]